MEQLSGLTHFILDTTGVVSDIFENNLINSGNTGKYFTEISSEAANKQFVLNLLITSWVSLKPAEELITNSR